MGNAAAIVQDKELSHETVGELAEILEHIGPAYKQYKSIVIDNAIDGETIAQFRQENEFCDFLQELGFTKAHTKVLWTHFRKINRKESNQASNEQTVEKYDAFLTHDWGMDELNRNNHERVSKVNKLLQAMNIRTWFDEERMEGNVRNQMARGIESTEIAVVFITQRYRDKVNGNDNRDNCKVSTNMLRCYLP